VCRDSGHDTDPLGLQTVCISSASSSSQLSGTRRRNGRNGQASILGLNLVSLQLARNWQPSGCVQLRSRAALEPGLPRREALRQA